MRYLLLISAFFSCSIFGQDIMLKSVMDCDYSKEIESLDYTKKENIWYNVYSNDLNIPKFFNNYRIVHEIIDYDQVVYQSCKSGIWSNDRLIHYVNRWGIDTIGCSPKIINSFINGAIGYYNGHRAYVLDENNNLDLSDDKIHDLSDSIFNHHDIAFERFINDEIIVDTVSIQILAPKFGKDNEVIGLNYKYCEFRKTQHTLVDSEIEILLFPGRWYLYHKDPKFIIKSSDGEEQTISINQYFNVKNTYYKITHVSKKGDRLSIQKHPSRKVPISNQIGYSPPPLQITDSYNLGDLKGKYVYLYFWNIDCSPCLLNIPKKFSKYNTSEYSNFKIILITVDKHEESREFLKRNNITWTNIETYGNSRIYNDFDITQFPQEFLINPEGVLIEVGFDIQLENYLK